MGAKKMAGWTVKQPICRVEVIGSSFILFAAFAGFLCCIGGVDTIPKCRYGEPECYFSVKVCPFNAQSPRIGPTAVQGEDGCQPMIKTRAVEGRRAAAILVAIMLLCLSSVLWMCPAVRRGLGNNLPFLSLSP